MNSPPPGPSTPFGLAEFFEWDRKAWAHAHAVAERIVANHQAASDRELGAVAVVTALPGCILAAAMSLDAHAWGFAATFIAGAMFTALGAISLLTAHNERSDPK